MLGGGAGRSALIRASFMLERFHSSASSILPRLLAPIPWPALSPGAFLFGLVLFYFQSRTASVYKVKVFVRSLSSPPPREARWPPSRVSAADDWCQNARKQRVESTSQLVF